MRIKLDENMPADLATTLAALGHDVDTTPQEDLVGADDGAIWAAANHAGRFLITQDLDFADIRNFEPGTHPGILIVRLPGAGLRTLVQRVQQAFQSENVETWSRCVAVVTQRKIRVRRPPE